MTAYALTLSLIVVLFLTSKTEQSRIVTIQRPMVITQERKTPAYYLYQQAQKIGTPVTEDKTAGTTYLANLSVQAPQKILSVSEMRVSKTEALAAVRIPASELSFPNQIPERPVLTFNKPQGILSDLADDIRTDLTAEATVLPPEKKWATIKGKLELIDGVGIVDHYIEIKRIEEGKIKEMGRIDLRAGSYTIDIESPTGYLIAQIKDQKGTLVGQDRKRIANLQSRGSYFEGPFMRVGQPESIGPNLTKLDNTRTSGTNNKMATPFSTGMSSTVFDNQNVLESANGAFSNISSYSTTISRVFDPSRIYSNITTLRHTGDTSQTEMFTSRWVDGVVSYVSDLRKIEFKSKDRPLILGKVISAGKPVAGAQVQIESIPGIEPIYFDQFMIPSLKQNATSENGYFMFIGVESGVYNLTAFKEDVILGSQFFVAEEGFMAFQNISSLTAPVSKNLRTFDAFSGSPIAAEVSSSASSQILELPTGSLSFDFRTEFGLSEFIATAAPVGYLPVRYIQNARQDYVHIPMITEAWFSAVSRQKHINQMPNTGVIIGFTEELNYDAYLVSENYSQDNVVYFDSSGNLQPLPVKGGGFILFNVPSGAKEVLLQEKGTDRIYSQVFNILPEQISISHFIND